MIGKLIANLFRCPQSELGIIVKRSIVSDATVDRIVVRDIFKAPEHADLRRHRSHSYEDARDAGCVLGLRWLFHSRTVTAVEFMPPPLVGF
jgi:hypothetical protein